MALQAFNENLVFSHHQVAAVEAPGDVRSASGGVVEKNSVVREKDGVTVHFRITDTAQTVNVEYKGILPDLFAEEQGVVAQGKLNEAGVFVAVKGSPSMKTTCRLRPPKRSKMRIRPA